MSAANLLRWKKSECGPVNNITFDDSQPVAVVVSIKFLVIRSIKN